MPNKYEAIAEAVCQKVIGFKSLTGNGDLRTEISKAIQTAVNEAVERQINTDAHIACDSIHHVGIYKLSAQKKGEYLAKRIRTQKREV